MKKLILISFWLLAMSPLFAQSTPPQATLSADSGIKLDVSKPLSATYVIAMPNLNAPQNEAQAGVSKLDALSNLISMQLDYPNHKITMTLNLSAPAANGWGVAEWNNHLKNIR